ncbi:AAA family ATPase [Paenibacillus mucilaginosus]|uniref:Predicted nucleoside kinase, CMP and AMP kinase n=1 Tax=Paenibacillus mucilaginosus (strain KNP414) TaxID=1036673 RepID=F8F7W8_PAEMK|nr:AAA family ATPase [Paenibacillus mucilaginosus]AEI40872.1 predicted nucleoside kinase, CMP and AMP kinase [Paenibacillus mucilaginosus KNP414]MCG7211663.1 AAA family ATPase [Paenibacillus mucilaginosus]WDM29978.1 AAA family ATPase [Paenibacillus mucilaginosus]
MTGESKTPLFIVTGASGSGKTTVIPELRRILPDMAVFDIDDILPFAGEDWHSIRNIWFRVARGLAESGRMTVICGTVMPWDAEQCEDYPYFANVYYLNLHCDEESREARLRARSWPEERIAEHLKFAGWLLDNADQAYTPPMSTLDTSETVPAEVALGIREWIHSHAGRGSMKG